MVAVAEREGYFYGRLTREVAELKNKGLKEIEIAEALGISQATVSKRVKLARESGLLQ